jgi:hypothetical protein
VYGSCKPMIFPAAAQGGRVVPATGAAGGAEPAPPPIARPTLHPLNADGGPRRVGQGKDEECHEGMVKTPEKPSKPIGGGHK